MKFTWQVMTSAMKKTETELVELMVSHERKTPDANDGVWRWRVYSKDSRPVLGLGEENEESIATQKAEAFARLVHAAEECEERLKDGTAKNEVTERTLGVWRVFNGLTGFSAIHRIAVAHTEEMAIVLAQKAGMDTRHNPTAERVCDAQYEAVEAQDYD
jgi:hypothetical protein